MLLIFLAIIAFGCNKATTELDSESTIISGKKKAVDITITSNEGCLIRIQGDVEFTILPPEITGFTGTITFLGGGANCPTGVLTFGMISSGQDLTISLDNSNPCLATVITWSGSFSQEIQILQQLNIQNTLLAEFEAITDC